MTVGSGIGPDLLTFRRSRKRSRARASPHLPPVGNRTPPWRRCWMPANRRRAV